MQIKTTMSYHFIPVECPSSRSLQIVNAVESVEKSKLFCSVFGNVNLCSYYGEQYGGYFKN